MIGLHRAVELSYRPSTDLGAIEKAELASNVHTLAPHILTP